MKTCPYCEAEIAHNAKKCKYCWEIVVEEKKARLCPYCEAELSETARKCKHCWEWVEEPEQSFERDEEKKENLNKKSIEVSQFQKKWLLKASWFRFFCAQFLDFLIARIPILWLANLLYMRILWTSIWYSVFWLIALNENAEPLTWKQKRIFTYCYFPNLFHITYFVPIILLWNLLINYNITEIESVCLFLFTITCLPWFINILIWTFSQESSIEWHYWIRRYIRDLPAIKKASGFFVSNIYLFVIACFWAAMFSRSLPSYLYEWDYTFWQIAEPLQWLWSFFLGIWLLWLVITYIISLFNKESPKTNYYKHNRSVNRYLALFWLLILSMIVYAFARIWLKMY